MWEGEGTAGSRRRESRGWIERNGTAVRARPAFDNDRENSMSDRKPTRPQLFSHEDRTADSAPAAGGTDLRPIFLAVPDDAARTKPGPSHHVETR